MRAKQVLAPPESAVVEDAAIVGCERNDAGMRPASIGFLKTLSIPIVGPIGTWRRRIAVTQTTREKV
jgi:hypothetical protein